MDLLIVSRVTFETCVEIAAKHDAHLNGAKGLADACEFHWNLQGQLRVNQIRIALRKEEVQQSDRAKRQATTDARGRQTASLFVLPPDRIQ
jgi:hypothetical protein